MIAGFYYEQRIPVTDKVPDFYLPNRSQFQMSIGLDFENRISKQLMIEEEIIILAHFCENLGPVPLIIYPTKSPLKTETIDMIVLKAMSVDYQSYEHDEVVFNCITQTLVLDCSIPFFVYYFTVWDIYARGYVRPCCIIVCCRDKIRARKLFISKNNVINEMLKPLMRENINHFYQDLQKNKQIIDKMVLLNSSNKLFEDQEFSLKHLRHLQTEYENLIGKIHDQFKNCEEFKTSETYDLLFDMNLAMAGINRELRSIYVVMRMNEIDMITTLALISRIFKESSVSESFSLSEIDTYKNIHFDSNTRDCCSKCNVQYFNTAFVGDKIYSTSMSSHSRKSSNPICVCGKGTDYATSIENLNTENQVESLFPNLTNIKAAQCHYISHQCKQLGIPIMLKLISCLFHQCHLVIFIENQQPYLNLMNFLRLFLPKQHEFNYFTCKPDWPNLKQIKETPVMFVNKETKSPEMPSELKGLVAIYDFPTNHFLSGPKYVKGHLSNFLETFKHLEFNHLHLDTIVNIMLLNYLDMVYQWISLLGRKDRKTIADEHFLKLGYTPEDIAISEKLTLLVLQSLASSKSNSAETNLFFTSKVLFNKDGK